MQAAACWMQCARNDFSTESTSGHLDVLSAELGQSKNDGELLGTSRVS